MRHLLELRKREHGAGTVGDTNQFQICGRDHVQGKRMIETHEGIARTGVDEDGSWTLTATGKKMVFLKPEFEAICLEDIVTHTSNLNRFTGATRYSVAQHSMFVGGVIKGTLDDENVDREHPDYWDQILAGLLHDAEEAYVNDLSSPMKVVIKGKYQWVSTGIRRKIFEKYGIDWAYHNAAVKSADNIAMLVERYYFIPDHPDWPKVPKAEMTYPRPEIMPPDEVAKKFYATLKYAINQRDLYRVEASSEDL